MSFFRKYGRIAEDSKGKIVWGGIIAQSIEHLTPGHGSNPLFGHHVSYWQGQCKCNVTDGDKRYGFPALSLCITTYKLSDISLGSRPGDSSVDIIVADDELLTFETKRILEAPVTLDQRCCSWEEQPQGTRRRLKINCGGTSNAGTVQDDDDNKLPNKSR